MCVLMFVSGESASSQTQEGTFQSNFRHWFMESTPKLIPKLLSRFHTVELIKNTIIHDKNKILRLNITDDKSLDCLFYRPPVQTRDENSLCRINSWSQLYRLAAIRIGVDSRVWWIESLYLTHKAMLLLAS